MNEREKKCFLASFGGEYGAERNPINYQRRDDANHFYKSDGYYEWWYVDASFEDDWHMVAVFFARSMMENPPVPFMSVSIYNSKGVIAMQRVPFEPEQVYAGADWCDVRIGDNWLKDKGNGIYEMYVNMDGFGGHLTMKSVVPGWKLGTGFNYKDEEKGLVAGWVVPVPNAEISGELFLGKEGKKTVSGAAYHDHNWGNFPASKTNAGWYWGRIHNDRYTLDYAWVMPREKDAPVFSPLLIARKGEIILSTNSMEAVFENPTKEENQLGPEFAKRLTFKANHLGVEMTLTIETKRIIENRQLPKSEEWDQFYFRFLADYTMEIVIDGKRDEVKGELLHEYMVL